MAIEASCKRIFVKVRCTIVKIVITWENKRNIFRNLNCLLYEMPIKNILIEAKPRNFKMVINFVSQNFAKIEHRFERNIFFTMFRAKFYSSLFPIWAICKIIYCLRIRLIRASRFWNGHIFFTAELAKKCERISALAVSHFWKGRAICLTNFFSR